MMNLGMQFTKHTILCNLDPLIKGYHLIYFSFFYYLHKTSVYFTLMHSAFLYVQTYCQVHLE